MPSEPASPSGTITKEQWGSIGKGLALACLAAAITYASDLIPGLDIPQDWKLGITAVLSAVLNTLRKLLGSTPATYST